MKGEHAPVNGLKIYYEIHGPAAGTPLVLLHGGGSSIDTTFGVILPMLAKGRRIIAFDQQGHGRTADIAEQPFSFERSADDAAALLKYLKIEKADFFGFSNGGHIAVQVAIRHPELVKKLIVASAFTSRDGAIAGFWDGFDNANLQMMPSSLQQSYSKISPHPDRLQSFFDKSVARMNAFKDFSATDIQAIVVPTFILAGDTDVITPEHAVELYRLFPRARLAILPGGHGTYIGEVTQAKHGTRLPELTVAMLEEFLDADN